MLSVYNANGIVAAEPQRTSEGNSLLGLLVKRDDNTNHYDFFYFKAFGKEAKFINTYLHKGDIVSLTARPKEEIWEDKKCGKKERKIVFIIKSISFICHKNRTTLNQFGGSDFPELQDVDYAKI